MPGNAITSSSVHAANLQEALFLGEVAEPCAAPIHQGVCGDRGRCLLGRRRDERQHVCIRPLHTVLTCPNTG
jgi:hypothetical protein